MIIYLWYIRLQMNHLWIVNKTGLVYSVNSKVLKVVVVVVSGNKVLKSHYNLSLNVLLDVFLSSEDGSFEVYDEDIKVHSTGKNSINKSKEIKNNSCYIVFWEYLPTSFIPCHYCNAKVENAHNYTKGAILQYRLYVRRDIFSNGHHNHYLINNL